MSAWGLVNIMRAEHALTEPPSASANCDEFKEDQEKTSRTVIIIDRTLQGTVGHAAILVGDAARGPRMLYDPNGNFTFGGKRGDREVFVDSGFNFIKFLEYQGHIEANVELERLREEWKQEWKREQSLAQNREFERRQKVSDEWSKPIPERKMEALIIRNEEENKQDQKHLRELEQRHAQAEEMELARIRKKWGGAEVYIFDTTNEDEEEIMNRMRKIEGRFGPDACGSDNPFYLYCAICVTEAIKGIGPFKGLTNDLTRPPLTLPDTLAVHLERRVGKLHRCKGERGRRVPIVDYIKELKETPRNIDL
jgi:hypothetical protein